MRKVLDREKRRKVAVQGENGEAELISASTSSLLSSTALDLDIDTIFSGEEFYGRFLDLISLHEQFINLKFVQRKLTYLQFLDKFYDFSDEGLYPLSYRLRQGDYFKEYVAYLLNLHQYLQSFLVKTSPLSQHQTIIKRIEQEFDELWESNKLPEWIQNHKTSSSNDGTADGDLNVSNNGEVYCKPCSKVFKNQAVYNGHLNGSKHKKNVAALGNSESNGSSSDFKFRKISFHEYCIYSFALFLEKRIGDTKANVERRQALTDRERQLEIESLQREVIGDDRKSDSDDGEQDKSDDDQEEVIYNPLKLPLGWDGKPIPFWLWKLNGLGIEFSCEICGNYTYMGRKAFEIHFMEARHIHGLNCLGVETNLLMYRGITEISQAQALVSKFKSQQRRLESKTENAVEMEDEEGNVMSVKVYNDLKKQGLI
jgi:splicing factor 3A subunit 3